METQLTGVMDDELIDELQKIAQRFKGKIVRVVIQEVNHPRKGDGLSL